MNKLEIDVIIKNLNRIPSFQVIHNIEGLTNVLEFINFHRFPVKLNTLISHMTRLNKSKQYDNKYYLKTEYSKEYIQDLIKIIACLRVGKHTFLNLLETHKMERIYDISRNRNRNIDK